MNVVICDDNPLIAKDAEIRVLNHLSEFDVTTTCFFSGKALLDHIDTKPQIDIAIIDIELENGISGIDIAKKLNTDYKKCKIIYLTGYAEYVSPVYETAHEYFVLKTEIEKFFDKALDSAIKALNEKKKSLYIESRFEKAVVDFDDILYIERNKRTTFVKCKNICYKTSEKLDSIAARLDENLFVRCHNSFIVNMSAIRQYKDEKFILHTGESLTITRTYKKTAVNKFLDYISL